MKQISRYEVLGEVGRGAMGVVYKARDPQLGRLIAIKTITASVADDPGLLERFRTEAKAAGALQHPNIVTIYEMGEADGVPFIAMEYLEGESLDALISRRAQISVAQKTGWLVHTCRALQYAHKHGVIHRDVKPANIVVTLEGEVKVVDFGIARLAGTSKTQTGALLGTLAYMSPQQIRGERADARSDIWSLGVVLYELLTFRRPFDGENHAAVLLSILQKEPVPLRELLKDCPHQLDGVSRRTLAKDYATRYQNMEELLLELKSAWAALHLNKAGETPASVAHKDVLEPVPRHTRTLIAPPPEKIGIKKLPAGNAPSIALAAKPKAISIPAVPVTGTVMAAQASSPSPASLALAKPLKARSWQREISFAAIGLAVLAGIGLEANRVMVHSHANAQLPVASTPQAAPKAVISTEDQPSGAAKPTPDAQFNAAVAHFNQAVAAKDAPSLKLLVRPAFQQIAQGGGPRAKDAEVYIASTIPRAVLRLTPWPPIRCPNLPETETQASVAVPCGVLDAPKLQWVQFSWPEFPVRARKAGLDNGVAMVSLTVDQGGFVVEAVSRVPPDSYGFINTALHVALKWKTTVPRLRGKAVATQFSVDVPFTQ